jgi:hypothetical protein
LHSHRDDQRLLQEVGKQAPSEAASEQRAMDRDAIRGQTGDVHRDVVRHLHALRWRPDLATLCGDVRRAVHRLHRRVRLKRNFVHGFDTPRVARHGLIDVALLLVREERTGGELFAIHSG